MKGKTKAQLLKVLRKLEESKKVTKERIRPAILRKQQIVQEIRDLLRRYKCVAIISLDGVPTPQYKKIKQELSKYGFIKVYKNSIFLRAAREEGLPNVDELEKYLIGTNAFMFTNMNPYELALLLDKLAVPKYAKPGDVATDDIYIPEGPTGIPPGPMLSVFGKLRIRTQVREGVIWIAKETKVASAGDKISPELASLLRKLDIKPVVVKLRPRVVWEDGNIIPAEQLKVDVDAFRDDLLRAVSIVKEVAIEAALPLPDILPEIIARAYRRAAALAGEAGFVTPETAAEVFRRAMAKALALALQLQQKAPDLGIEVSVQVAPAAPAAAGAPAEEKKEEEEEEEEKEVSEEEIAEGISSLFG